MSKLKQHTPAPWILIDGDGFDKEKVITSEQRLEDSMCPICEMDVYFDEPFGTEQDANARLIATAPELLDAILKVREDINYMLNSREFLNGFVFDYIDDVIAKATGG